MLDDGAAEAVGRDEPGRLGDVADLADLVGRAASWLAAQAQEGDIALPNRELTATAMAGGTRAGIAACLGCGSRRRIRAVLPTVVLMAAAALPW